MSFLLFFKQKTAYEVRISDWSSDVCSSDLVLAGVRLQGTCTVGDTMVPGTIAPGNSIGTLNVAGNIGFAAGSTYEVEVNAAGEGDLIAASGAATIDGGSVKVLAGAGDYRPQTDYKIGRAHV